MLKIYTVAEAAAAAGIHPTRIYDYVCRGTLTPLRESPLLFSRGEIERFCRIPRPRGNPTFGKPKTANPPGLARVGQNETNSPENDET